jgi:NitT/TauT family transport system substrate-binding protein
VKQSLFESASDAFSVGFLGKTEPDLSGIYDLTILNEVLKSKGLPEIDGNSGLANTTTQSNVTSNINGSLLQ